MKEVLKFKLRCELETDRDLRVERQIITLFMRTINNRYDAITVDLDLDESDFHLQSTFEYIYSMYSFFLIFFRIQLTPLKNIFIFGVSYMKLYVIILYKLNRYFNMKWKISLYIMMIFISLLDRIVRNSV